MRAQTIRPLPLSSLLRSHKTMIQLSRTATVLPLLSVLLLAGCLVSSTNHQSVSGNFVPENTFDRIKPGETSSSWVQATLGDPSTKEKADDTDVWKYSYTEVKEGSGAIFLIFGGSDKKERQRTAYVEFKDGIVKSKWRS
jgi:outer membrane protein assembly factor BamE (lipoprotein component of BamABCDE complex)